jgi:hypothetical protein
MGIISKSPTMTPTNTGSSKPQNTAVGSGSRPTAGKTMTPTSAPENAKTLGRDPGGALK